MPLERGSSPATVSANIRELHKGKTFARTESKFGKNRANKQAVAIALDQARRSRQFGGGFNMAKAPHIGMSGPMAYPARAMMRGMMRGALLTPTLGRADAHKTFVPSGSYVIPADVVSGRGEGNTLAGANILHNMFGMQPFGAGKSGPYSAGMPHIKTGRAPKLPKPPKMQNIMAASGGGKEGADEHLGEPVPVNLSGGEVVVPPENLIATFRRIFPTKNYSLKQIHRMMDTWVMNERDKHRKTLGKLPPPAVD